MKFSLGLLLFFRRFELIGFVKHLSILPLFEAISSCCSFSDYQNYRVRPEQTPARSLFLLDITMSLKHCNAASCTPDLPATLCNLILCVFSL